MSVTDTKQHWPRYLHRPIAALGILARTLPCSSFRSSLILFLRWRPSGSYRQETCPRAAVATACTAASPAGHRWLHERRVSGKHSTGEHLTSIGGELCPPPPQAVPQAASVAWRVVSHSHASRGHVEVLVPGRAGLRATALAGVRRAMRRPGMRALVLWMAAIAAGAQRRLGELCHR